MKKILIIGLLLFSFICGCSELNKVESIKKKYPTGEIYRMDSDEFIVILNNDSVRYINFDFDYIWEDHEIIKCIGYDTTYENSMKDVTD